MNRRVLPKSIKIKDIDIPIDSDYRNILDIFQIMNDPNLLDQEKTFLALQYFYETDDYQLDINSSVLEMLSFIQGGSSNEDTNTIKGSEKPLFDWEQDFDLIIAPVNRILGYDARGKEYLHWWTFLSAFMEIGECTFNTFVSIRHKLNSGKKLDKAEEKIYKDNRDRIVLKKHYDDVTQALIDEILGKGV